MTVTEFNPRALLWALPLLLLQAACEEEDPAGPDLDEDRTYEVAFEAGTEFGTFLSVWGPSTDEVWAVGGQVPAINEPGTGMMFRRDADGWSEVTLPGGTPLLNWVHGAGDTVWTVGNAGAALRNNGDGWQAVPTMIDQPLWGVFVFSDSDAWAVGGNAFVEGSAVLAHYTGGSWKSVELPPLDREIAALFKVWGVAANDVWAVGDNGVIIHYDGSAWSQVPSGTVRDLISLWGTGPDEIVAVGGRDVAAIARWDGSSWTSENIGELPGLNGVWVNAGGSAVIVGGMGSAAYLDPGGFEHHTLDSEAGFNVLHAVFGLEDGTRISVGGTLDRNPPYTGIIIEGK